MPAGKVGMMARGGRRDRVFISYRRADSAGHAGRLEDELTRILGDRIFMDVSDIAPGADFERVLNDELASCGVVLAVIGAHWKDAFAAPREGKDYVLLELAQALALEGVQVVPVLMQGASLPAAGDLPAGLQALAGRQAVVIRDDRWKDDVAHLARGLRTALGLPRPALRWAVAGALGVCGATLAVVLNLPPAPGPYSQSAARGIAASAVVSAVAECRPAARPAGGPARVVAGRQAGGQAVDQAGDQAVELVGECPLVFQFEPDGRTRKVYFDSGSCILKAPPFGPCMIDALAPVRIPPFNDIAEADVGLNLRLAADGSVTVTPDP